MRGTLRLKELKLQVHLGCSASERALLQEIRISIDIRMRELPAACHSDSIEDTLCYGKLSEEILAFCKRSSFQTIEKLSMGCYTLIESLISKEDAFRISLHKVNPPVDALFGGAFFEIESDFWQ